MTVSRRGVLGALLAVPAVIRTPGLLMPVKVVKPAFYSGGTVEPRADAFVEFIRANQTLEEWQGEILKQIARAFAVGPDRLKVTRHRQKLAFAAYGKAPFMVCEVLWKHNPEMQKGRRIAPPALADSA